MLSPFIESFNNYLLSTCSGLNVEDMTNNTDKILFLVEIIYSLVGKRTLKNKKQMNTEIKIVISTKKL